MVRVIQFEAPEVGFENYVNRALQQNGLSDNDIINMQIVSARPATRANGTRVLVYRVVVFAKNPPLTREQILKSHY